jgi:hypothetical protein
LKETLSLYNNSILLKLIYFWAFIEAGLGGLLHLLHIPLTGFVIGGFAVIVNVLLAKFGNNKASVFFKALGIVLAVKFLLSPYTPFGAYTAVSFQGLLAVGLFSLFGLNKVTVFLFATLVMLESGIQKPLMTYLIFGRDFWDSAVVLIGEVFSISKQKVTNSGIVFLTGYILLYFIWGIVLSYWSNYLRKNIENLQPSKNILSNMVEQIKVQQKLNKLTGKSYLNLLAGIIIFSLLLFIPLLAGKLTVLYLVRIFYFLSILFFVAPILVRKHQLVLFKRNRNIVSDIAAKIPAIKIMTQVAWGLVSQQHGLKKIKHFVTYAIWLNVFYEQPANA